MDKTVPTHPSGYRLLSRQHDDSRRNATEINRQLRVRHGGIHTHNTRPLRLIIDHRLLYHDLAPPLPNNNRSLNHITQAPTEKTE